MADNAMVEQAIERSQRALVRHAEEVIARLPFDAVQMLAATSPVVDARTGLRTRLWKLQEDPPPLYHAAVAISEIARKFGSLLSKDRRGATMTVALLEANKIVLVTGNERRHIPHDYLVSCLMDGVGLSWFCANNIWLCVIALLKENRIQLPCLIASVLADTIILALEEDVLGLLTSHARVPANTSG